MQALADRVQDIRGYLVPATPDEIAVQVARLFTIMRKRNEGFEDEAQRITLYVELLADVPRVALDTACRNFLLGKVGDGWLPVPGDIRNEAKRHYAHWQAEIERINAILNAAVVAPNDYGMRAANLKHVRDTIHMLKGAIPKSDMDTRWAAKMQDMDAADVTPKVAAEKWLETYAEQPKSAPVVSNSLRKWIAKSGIPSTGAGAGE